MSTEQQDRAMLAAAPSAPAEPESTPIAKRKLDDLIAQGYSRCGVMIERRHESGAVERGAVSDGGMVIWWPTETAAPQSKKVGE